MRIYDLFKQTAEGKVFIQRSWAASEEVILPDMPALPAGEQYLPPEEVTDPNAYQRAIAQAQERASDPRSYYGRQFWLGTAKELQQALEELKYL